MRHQHPQQWGMAAGTNCVHRAGLSCGIFSVEAVPVRQPQGQHCWLRHHLRHHWHSHSHSHSHSHTHCHCHWGSPIRLAGHHLQALTNPPHQLQCADVASLTTLANCSGRALPSASGTCPGGTYSAVESTCKGSGTTDTCWVSCTVHPLPILSALLCALASALRLRLGTKEPTET